MSIIALSNVSIRYIMGDFKDIGLKDYVVQRMKGNYHVTEFWADRNISFSLEKGDMLGIIGTNGAGKSTLLKAMSGIMEPTKGKVKRKGTVAALLELSSGFDKDLTVRENTYLRGAMLGYSRSFMDQTYEQIIEFAELQDFQDRPFKQLSSGMKSRLAFSIASLVKPDILILDEVLSVGDGAFRQKSEKKMREIIAGGATTILVSHSLSQIRTMCNKVLWLNKGEQIEFGDDVQGICDRYEAFLAEQKVAKKQPEKRKSTMEQKEESKAPDVKKQTVPVESAETAHIISKEATAQVKTSAASPLPATDRLDREHTEVPPQRNDGWRSLYFDLWQSLTGWKLFVFYTLHYTLLFAVMCHFVFEPFREAEKLFIWTTDGMPIWFTGLVYLSQTIRDGIANLFSANAWTFPLYDFRLGSVKQMVAAEPITLLAALFDPDTVDALYDPLVIARYYLAGLSFSLFGFQFSRRPIPLLCGTLSYLFCGFGIYAGVRHPCFLAPMIFLPLLLLGTEKILRGGKPWLFVTVVFWAVVTSVYFAFMLALMVFLYFVARMMDLYTREERKTARTVAGKFFMYGALGVMLSGVVLIPGLLQNMDTGRIGRSVFASEEFVKYFFYGEAYYQKFLGFYLTEPGDIGSWTCLGFSVLTLPAVLSLFMRRKRETRGLRGLYAILTVMLLTRFVGYALSGFNGISNRWCFAYALCVSCILMLELPHLVEGESKHIAAVSTGCVIYYVLCYFTICKQDTLSISGAILLGIGLVLLQLTRQLGARRTMAACLLVTCLSVNYSSYRMYDSSQKNYISEFVSINEPYRYFDKSQYASFSQYSDCSENDFYRVAGSSISLAAVSSSFYWNEKALTGYSSYLYSNYIDWIKSLDIPVYLNNLNYGIDGRLGNYSLANVAFYVYRNGSKAPVPYGFKEVASISNEKSVDRILENQYNLPVGYTYSTYMTREEFESLNAPERQEAELQSIVLQHMPRSAAVSHEMPAIKTEMIPTEVEKTNGLTWEKGKLKVSEEKATMVLSFAGKPNSETYVRVKGLDLTSGESNRRWNLTASADGVSSNARFTADGYMYSNNQKTKILNLGYSAKGITSCTLTFPEKGTFKLEDIEIWCMPVDHYAEWINALREETLENVETNWRGLTGTISVSKDKILCLSIPYDSGWTAYVDGHKVELMQANIGWMAVELAAGDHTVELRYWTPGLTEGITLSVSGVICLAGLFYFKKRKTRKENGEQIASQKESPKVNLVQRLKTRINAKRKAKQ